MNDYVISCCSTADLTKEHFEKRNINYICFHYELDGQNYLDDLGQSKSFPEFYSSLANGAETKTSQVNAAEFEEYFRKFLLEGKDIIHVTLSSGLSGVINSANSAKAVLEEEFPNRKIYIIDSLGASSGYGMLMDKLADLKDEGYPIEVLRDWALAHRLRLNHLFFSTDLTFYIKGGRISKSAGIVGQALNICPFLDMNNEGKLTPRAKIRTKKKVIKAMVDKMIETVDDGLNYSGKCYLSHSNCYQDALEVANIIEATFPNLSGKVEIYWVGTTIGSHTGPGTVALYYFGKQREA